MDQIYTITTDNGANMLKAVKMLSLDYFDETIVEENKRANVDDDIDLQLDLDELTEESKTNEPEDHAENILQDIESTALGVDISSSILTGAAF